MEVIKQQHQPPPPPPNLKLVVKIAKFLTTRNCAAKVKLTGHCEWACCNIFLMKVGSQSVAVILTDVCWLSRLAFDDPSVGTSPLNSTFFLFFLTEQCNNISGLKLIEQNQHISKLQSFFSSKLEISFIRIEKSPLSQWRKHLQQG